MFIYDDRIRVPSFLTVLPIIGTALVLNYGSGGTKVASILSNKVLVFIGLLSYSAYLLHQPIFVIVDFFIDKDKMPYLKVFVIFLFAFFLYFNE